MTLYIDPVSQHFPGEYTRWIKAYSPGSFRLRYKPNATHEGRQLVVSGYGVDLSLKRTDYIVIDDRESGRVRQSGTEDALHEDIVLTDGDVSDVSPLSSSDLSNLALNAASYIMSSEDRMQTLGKISQDFPKYSASLAHHNATSGFLREHRANRDLTLRPGANELWLNGQQVSAREVDAYSLLEVLRRERSLVNKLQQQGLTAMESIDLMSHSTVAAAQGKEETQRYDFRDDLEGGNVIIWLNDLERDQRYLEWPNAVSAYLQRVFPGQLPAVRKNAQTVVYPLDLARSEDLADVVESLQGFVKRTLPIRFGIVPIINDDAIAAHAQVVYYLHEAYGLSAMMEYLQACLRDGTRSRASEVAFATVAEGAKLRKGQPDLSLSELSNSDAFIERIERAKRYAVRLGLDESRAPMLTNGSPVPRSGDWVQVLSQRLSMDLRIIQQAVWEAAVDDDTWLPSVYVNGSVPYRDPLLVPEDASNVTLVDFADVLRIHHDEFSELQVLHCDLTKVESHVTSVVAIGDFDDQIGARMALHAATFAANRPDVQVRLLHQSVSGHGHLSIDGITRIQELVGTGDAQLSLPQRQLIGTYLAEDLVKQTLAAKNADTTRDSKLASAIGVNPGDRALLVNGRLIGPLPNDRILTPREIGIAVDYERQKRTQPVASAVADMHLETSMADPLAMAKIATALALRSASDSPEGIFDNPTGPRTDQFNEWTTSETCITLGEKAHATVQMVAAIDPSSEIAQQWIPIIRILSRLAGVYTRIFLNPKERLQELPTKRFYRHVLDSLPRFEASGSLATSAAHFAGIPKDTLLTMTMDVPPAWLVAPKHSVHDLDNLRLSSLQKYESIDASYELESILIEGHSRDTTTGSPPRGAQLVLRTGSDAEQAGTIVMANLGYFQFKAAPGVYELGLQDGPSNQIFNLDSAGTSGDTLQPSDNDTTISLTSFKGATVFPRLSRKPGMELEDVLEVSSPRTMNFVEKSAEIANNFWFKYGLWKTGTSEYLARGLSWGQKIIGMGDMAMARTRAAAHADINIFSVASGHLYERMLNIMMVSVMRHTDHSVKFWFIEQFLSPSFKSFLPNLAAKYGFSYEMVAYKWPHWLRAQQEKQRVIWGYKILFLDVLFPLDLDKIIFVDADQIVRTDLYDLVQHDLQDAPYGFAPMCDSRVEMEGFRFWKQGYWENFLRGKPYHISALYVVDLKRFREMAAGDRLRQQYHSLSADPASLSNLDQDLPNHMQHSLPIHSLPQEWLWCETWCSDASLQDARTIDLCNNPQTKEPKLDRAKRQVPEWTVYDNEIAMLAERMRAEGDAVEGIVGGAGIGEQEHIQQVEASSIKREL